MAIFHLNIVMIRLNITNILLQYLNLEQWNNFIHFVEIYVVLFSQHDYFIYNSLHIYTKYIGYSDKICGYYRCLLQSFW